MNEINKEERMQGLSGQQVSESKAKYGTNELAKKETESLWSMFIGAFDDIWIKVLCAALALKVILAVLGIFVPALSGGNDVVEIISIVIAIALATGFSTLSEYRNTSRSEALQEEYSKTYAKVVRDGKLVNILTSEIVKGDTILIQAGDKVPADGLLFEGKIKVSQAALNAPDAAARGSRPRRRRHRAAARGRTSAPLGRDPAARAAYRGCCYPDAGTGPSGPRRRSRAQRRHRKRCRS